MTPDEMAERLHEWKRDSERATGSMWARRVTCVEPEGERRTWVLSEGGRQVGLVRLRLRRRKWRGGEKRGWCHVCHRYAALTVDWPWGFMPRTGCTECDRWFGPHVVNPYERTDNEPPAWTVEASDRTRQLLGLDDAPELGQTDPHG